MIEGWEGLLAAHVEDARTKDFSWDKHNCGMWCAEWVRKSTGRDLLADWHGYSNEEELQALLRARGYASYESIADSYAPSKPVMLARRGDILLHPSGTLGICTGKDGVFITAKGVITHPTLQCDKAWEVG